MFKMCRIYDTYEIHVESKLDPFGTHVGSMLDPCGVHVGSMRESWVIHLAPIWDRIGISPKVLSRNFKLC